MKKNINLTEEAFIKNLKEYLENKNFHCDIKTLKRQDNQSNYQITISGNEPFIYAIYDTKRGLTVSEQGKNKEFAKKILDDLTSDAKRVEHKSQKLVGILQNIYDKVKEYHEKQEDYSIEEKICSSIQKNLTISKNMQKVIIQYYPTTERAILTGQTTYLWNEVFLEVTKYLDVNAKDIISLCIKTREDLQNLNITYDEGILDEYMKRLLGEDAYSNTYLMTDIEKKWLKVSAFLIYTEIEMPEYFASIASSIKVLEGLLNRILIDYHVIKKENFDCFESNKQKTKWNLKKEFNKNFSNDVKIIGLVNDLYNFIHEKRHSLFHNDGVNPEQITDKTKAITIFRTIIDLLRNIYDVIYKNKEK